MSRYPWGWQTTDTEREEKRRYGEAIACRQAALFRADMQRILGEARYGKRQHLLTPNNQGDDDER